MASSIPICKTNSHRWLDMPLKLVRNTSAWNWSGRSNSSRKQKLFLKSGTPLFRGTTTLKELILFIDSSLTCGPIYLKLCVWTSLFLKTSESARNQSGPTCTPLSRGWPGHLFIQKANKFICRNIPARTRSNPFFFFFFFFFL